MNKDIKERRTSRRKILKKKGKTIISQGRKKERWDTQRKKKKEKFRKKNYA